MQQLVVKDQVQAINILQLQQAVGTKVYPSNPAAPYTPGYLANVTDLSAKMAMDVVSDAKLLTHNLLPNPVRIAEAPVAKRKNIVNGPKKNTKRAKIALRREKRLNKLAKVSARSVGTKRLRRIYSPF